MSYYRRKCHGCDLATCSGKCVCTVSGLPIESQISLRRCPKGRYALQGLGDLIDWVLSAVWLGEWIKGLFKLAGRDCGCDRRRRRLNAWLPFGRGGSKAR
jgi:hypothetical protein